MTTLDRWSRAVVLLTFGLAVACTGEVASTGQPRPGTAAPGPQPPGVGNGGTSSTSASTGGVPSAGGTGPGSPTKPGTMAAAGTAAGGPAAGPVSVPIVGRVGLAARVSKGEYENSLLDVLGVALTPAELDSVSGGIPDDVGDGVFKHVADKQTSVEQYPLSYWKTAEAVAARVNITELAGRLGVSCTQASAECGAATISALGRRLYRRPLTQREVDAMQTVFAAALAEKLDYAAAVRWVLQALLQAPQFLFHLDDETSGSAGQSRELSGYELAARLSGFVWVSVPDDELLRLAGDGSLVRPEVLAAQVTRMLADAKAQRFTRAFMADFSRARFASYEGATDADRAALNESVVATFQDHVWSQQKSIAELFLTQRFVVNERVAQIMGLQPTGSGLQAVDVSALPQRVGLMSHPGIIAGMGDRSIGSFVNRGKYLMERLMCRNPAAVPAGLLTELENFNADTTGFNEHERAAVRKTRPECWGCHTQFEPFAFGFSRFDGMGRYVGEKDAEGRPLPLDGWVPTTSETDSRHYTDFASYMQILATEPVIQTCMIEHFIAFATARTTDDQAKVEAERVGKEYQAAGSTVAAMVSAVVKSPLFRTIVAAGK